MRAGLALAVLAAAVAVAVLGDVGPWVAEQITTVARAMT